MGGGVLAADSPAAASAADSLACEGPAISFADRFMDLGSFYADSVRQCTFPFVNTGDTTLMIIKVSTDCGCTIADHTASTVAPGDSAAIVVRFNGSGRRPGHFRKIVRVRSNAVNTPLVRLYISGTVKRNDKTW